VDHQGTFSWEPANNLIFSNTGRIRGDFYALGHPWAPVYLLDGSRPILFEAGFSCLGKIYEQAIRGVLGGRRPEILFITHVHFDHCGATSYLKRAFPGLQAAASSIAAQIINRPNAQRLIRSLNHDVISLMSGIEKDQLSDEPFEPFEVEVILTDGQLMEIENGLTVEILATPGHTRDFLCYYIRDKKILIASEAAGCADGTGQIFADFLVDYEDYLAGLKRLAALDVEVLCQGHQFVFVGEAVKNFFARSIESTERFRTMVEKLLRIERGSVEQVVARIKAEEYDVKPFPKQPEKAYILNLSARVRHIAQRFRDDRVAAKKN
jgi:glyoxylase-like metal-dependent hydrolase (beta-lactamase superfamily II)